MGERLWNEKQRQGFEARGGSLLVSAAAGSGKTSVLVERVLRRITDPEAAVDVDRLLIVTFTRAAAAEMRQRLSAALAKKAAADPENTLYQRQQMLLPQASISTVHGFCTALLREQAVRAGLPVGFQVAEDAQAKLLADQALDEVLEEAYRRRDAAFLALATQLNSQRDDSALREAVEQAYTFMQAQPLPERWLQEQTDAYTQVGLLEKTRWYAPLWQELQHILQTAALLAHRAAQTAQAEGLEPYRDALVLDIQRIERLRELSADTPYDEVRRLVLALTPERLAAVRAKDAAVVEAKEQVTALRKQLKKKIERIQSLFANSEEDCRRDLATMAPLVEALGGLVSAYTKRFVALKRQQKLLDYNDLEHECLHLLIDKETGDPTPLAVELSGRYEEIMVDEYQDTNAAQDALFRALSRRGENLFMVGDVKQSIYGFRQAMPAIFTARRDAYATYDPAVPVFPATITLEENFRSRRQVTDTVNFIFHQAMHRELGGVEYDQREALVCAAKYPESTACDTEWLLLDRSEDEDDVSDEIAEARLIARRIQRLCAEDTVGREGEQRPVTYGDICILLRARKHMATYAKELGRLGIPTAADETGTFLATPEIQTALSLLRVIDNPLREIELTAVMLSPLYGFTADQVAAVRLAGGKAPLYTALTMVTEDVSLMALCRRLLDDLARYRTLAVCLPADRLLERLLRDTGLTAVFAARPGGSQRVANLRQLDKVARGFEQGGFRGLSAFVRYIDRLEAQGKDLPAGNTLRPDGVRLMTVHGSKGLEFPVVFVSRLFGRSGGGDASAKLLFHDRAGIGMKLWDEESLDKHTTLPFMGVQSARLQDERAEELRVWYVALTRAKEKLIFTYTSKKLAAKLAALEEALPTDTPLAAETVLRAGNPGDWLLSTALRHPDFIGLRSHPATKGLACDTHWVVSVEQPGPVEEVTQTATAAVEADTELVKQLRQRLAYTYPYEALGGVPAKLAASQLSHEAMSRDYIAKSRPAFLQKEGMTAAQKGTALHTFMQFADLASAAIDLTVEVQRLETAGFLTDHQAAALDTEKIAHFLQGNLYARMAASIDCRREYHFCLSVPAGSLSDLPADLAGEPVVVQGIADCVFREGDSLVLVDYKTDRVKTPEELIERYRSQMQFYKQALESLLGLPVKEVLLYSFALGKEIQVDI